jgi:hypothetical protein
VPFQMWRENGSERGRSLVSDIHYSAEVSCARNLADAAFARNEVLGAVVVRVMAVRAFEGADVGVGSERIRALAGYTLTPQYGKALQTGFAFYEPDQSHRSANLIDRIFQFASSA